MRAALYARVSTVDKGQDPEVQLGDLREYAARRDFEVVAEFVDFASGIKNGRPSISGCSALPARVHCCLPSGVSIPNSRTRWPETSIVSPSITRAAPDSSSAGAAVDQAAANIKAAKEAPRPPNRRRRPPGQRRSLSIRFPNSPCPCWFGSGAHVARSFAEHSPAGLAGLEQRDPPRDQTKRSKSWGVPDSTWSATRCAADPAAGADEVEVDRPCRIVRSPAAARFPRRSSMGRASLPTALM